ncbi:hypothetical protein ABZW32_24910 [Streptomyces sp. NPDC004667]|uniref:hypothetical protein n=1 Tax=Streptomyces sp. NPDC004667 TaxID=3154285 RepID=UPI0033AEA453
MPEAEFPSSVSRYGRCPAGGAAFGFDGEADGASAEGDAEAGADAEAETEEDGEAVGPCVEDDSGVPVRGCVVNGTASGGS